MNRRLLFGAALLLLGIGLLMDGTPLRLIDMKDRQCRKALVGNGSACPSGCEARPLPGPEDRAAPPECHSRFWVATCGKACGPRGGLIRLDAGAFASSGKLIVDLDGPPGEDFDRALADLEATAEASFAGLERYEVAFSNPDDDARRLEQVRARLKKVPSVREVGYDLK